MTDEKIKPVYVDDMCHAAKCSYVKVGFISTPGQDYCNRYGDKIKLKRRGFGLILRCDECMNEFKEESKGN